MLYIHFTYKNVAPPHPHSPWDILAVNMTRWECGVVVPCPCSRQSGHLLPLQIEASSLGKPSPLSPAQEAFLFPGQGQEGRAELEEELILPCRGPRASLQAQRPLGGSGLVGIAGIWELESLERGAARAGQPDTWIMNLAESSEHRERKPLAFLWGPLWPKERSLWFLSM